jgi:hypothetical protein
MAIKKGVDMGDYIFSDKEGEAYRWCVSNGIYISPQAKSLIQWYICIEMNKKVNVSPDAYKKIEIWKQIFKYYTYYYDKYKK